MKIRGSDIEFDNVGQWSSMDFGEATLNDRTDERAPGLHVSDVVSALVKSAGFAPAESSSVSQWDVKAIWEVGFCWEQVIQTAWKGRRVFENRTRAILSQPKIELPINKAGDILHGTPDAWDYLNKVEESYKSSSKSMLKFESDPLSNFWGWFVQSKVYLYGLWRGRVPKTVTSRFFVLWLRGDYRHPSARTRVYTVQFEREDVEETWRMVRAQARRMLKKERQSR